jgi:tetratricopeptide (TPR) repeat protein
LAAVTLAVYLRTLGNGFVSYDDIEYITGNDHIQHGVTWEMFTWAMSSTYAANWHPLTWISHALDCQMFGLHPAGHHFTNALLHAVSVLVLFFILARATGALGASLIVAALFALHPLNVETVAWASERKSVLSTLLFFLNLAAYGWYARRPDLRRYTAVVALFLLGLATKPMVITLPFVLLLVDFWPLGRIADLTRPSLAFPVPQLTVRRAIEEKLPLLLLCIASAVITMRAQKVAMKTFPLAIRIGNALYSYVLYLWKVVAPVRLAVIYPHPGYALGWWKPALSTLFLIAVTTLAWRQSRQRLYLLIGWLWYLGTMVPVIGVVQVGAQSMADRYAYIPLIGIFVMVVWSIAELADSRRIPSSARWAIGALAILACGTLTWHQIGYWKDGFALWSHAAQVTEKNEEAEQNLGATLDDRGRFAEAAPHFLTAVRYEPGDPAAHASYAACLAQLGRLQEAIPEYDAAIRLGSQPGFLSIVYADLGTVYRKLGNPAKARELYSHSLQLDSQQPHALNGLAIMQAESQAQDLQERLAREPSDEGYLRLGEIFRQLGRIPEARAAYQHALQLNPASQAKAVLQYLDAQQQPFHPEPQP